MRVWVTGDRGMLGSAVVRRLASEPVEIVTAPRDDLDLVDQVAVQRWVRVNRPDRIIHCAAKVGGILANRDQPAEFIYLNMMIAANVIHAAHEAGVEKLVHIASSAIYPLHASQPLSEAAILTGPIDGDHVPYAIAKIAGIVMCQSYRHQYDSNFISAVPANLYGPGDSFAPATSHVVPAIIRKVHEAKRMNSPEIVIWGTGAPLRELLHVNDMADALVFLLSNYSGEEPINIGCGSVVSILELTQMICQIAGYGGRIVHDLAKPDGASRKLLDSSRLRALGWRPSIDLNQGLLETYTWFSEHWHDEG
ncbi:GDP-L-fucose synthase family protein [Novosphingobium malaysiense]|uniref:GDP-L-fucose synthase n=1 Tax=Novosphingobium malaysiense TaxID=1348853 RepID=A0A0B1ZG02_9SPHN|nr:GDP-L-fucose synthase [Novosphingobium malaysiense]KHK90021.1 hypothetical protein LK12_19255 [Novosphingobium malaysiense]